MYTTNMASRGLPMTYSQRRQECDKLASIAQRMEEIATKSNSAFLDNPTFQKLEALFKEQFFRVHTLAL